MTRAAETDRTYATDLQGPESAVLFEQPRRFLRLRVAGRKIALMREAWRLTLALLDLLRDPWAQPSVFDHIFQSRRDPWAYSTSAGQRYCQAARLLDDHVRLSQALTAEIGCAEGLFTRELAVRSRHVVALDWSEVALERARLNCAALTNVEFAAYNLRFDALPGTYDLLVIMDVLETIYRPWLLRRVMDKLVLALRPGGCLLVGNSRQAQHFETRWWAAPLLRGGKRIHDRLSADPRLEVLGDANGSFYVLRLLRRRQLSSLPGQSGHSGQPGH